MKETPATKLASRLLAILAISATTALANHPVFVEGEQDYDGDGLIGVEEDADVDPVGFPTFGTINAALGAANAGANQNGRVTIVTSGRFREVVSITGDNGNVTLEAAPGVEANIDAVASGDAEGNTARQAAPGIIVNAPNTRIITLRNLVSRNWTDGIRVQGESRVVIDNCRVENNLNYGIRVVDSAKATIDKCSVTASGFRVGADVSATPAPGVGISFEGTSSGLVCDTTVSGSFAAGIRRRTSRSVTVDDGCFFDNNPNLQGFGRKHNSRGSWSGGY
ncbi:MAG: right-handed parallel beta-helix repeat-containing protein [Verrucomicrobiota bacterium]|nr:right-handed parallel beta-helix repeat-containing protein [Verrucomicrobiota bacterium]